MTIEDMMSAMEKTAILTSFSEIREYVKKVPALKVPAILTSFSEIGNRY